MTLEELLGLLPDNDSGAISAADLREVVTELWNYTASVQATLNDVVVTGLPAAQSVLADQQIEITDLDNRVTVLEAS